MKYYFIGWSQDYEEDCINSLKNSFDIRHISFSKLTVFLARKNLSLFNAIVEKRLRKITDDDVVIISDSPFYYSLVKGLECRKVLIFRNTITEHTRFLAEDMTFFKYTFDSSDCQKYSLEYLYQFSSVGIEESRLKDEIMWDFYFLGEEKNRKKELNNMSDVIKMKGFTKKFILKKKPVTLWQRIICRLPYVGGVYKKMDYHDYISQVKKSRVLVDIVNPGQNGLTLRVIESLFLNKKLITNNHEVRNCSFYNTKNILVIDSNDIIEISNAITNDFVYGEFEKIPKEEKIKYLSNNVLGDLLRTFK